MRRVDEVIQLLGLAHVRHSIVGDERVRGVRAHVALPHLPGG